MDVIFAKDKSKDKKNNPFFDLTKKWSERIKNFKIPSAFYYFLVLIAVGFGFYLVMLFENNFSLAYGGDYSAQYIPMGYHVWDYYHDWIHTGHFTLFDTELYLGVNSIGSNAYYGLFSPFNIIIVIFPRTMVPQSVAIASMIKLACAGLFFSIYMKHAFEVKDSVARICGIAYAFCGWGAFYLWYNNYQDILVFFPLALFGIEKVLQEEKPWLLCVGVFFLAICNYVLMVPYIMCAFFYAMFRFFQRLKLNDYKTNLRMLGLGALGFAGGLLMSMFIFAPALMATMSSPKLDTNSYGGMLKDYLIKQDFNNFFRLLFSWDKAADQHNRVFSTRVYYPILEFFFPATTCRSLPTLELSGWDFDDIAVSLWCYVPMILFLVPALIQSGKEKKWSVYIGFALIVFSLFTPFMYFLTMAMTNAYARWTLFIPSSLIAYVGIYINKIPNVSRWTIHLGYAFAVLGIVAAWILTYKLNYAGAPEKTAKWVHRFAEKSGDYTNTAFIIELIYVTAVYLTLFILYNKKAFHILVSLFISAEAIAMGNFVTYGHGYDKTYNNGYAANERFRTVLRQVQRDDQSYYRVYTSIGDAYSVNNSFINGYNATSFFHSLYNFEVNDFSLWTGIRNGAKSVSGCYRGKYQDLDNLLGIKYYFISKQKSKYYLIEKYNEGQFAANVPFDFVRKPEYEDYTSEYLVYENPSLSNFGYAYDTIYTGDMPSKSTYYGIGCVNNSILLSRTAVLDKKDVEEITNRTSHIDMVSKKPNTTLKYLSKDNNYRVSFYKFSIYAKDYPFEKINTIRQDMKKESVVPGDANPMFYYAVFTPMRSTQPLFKAGTSLYVHAPFSGSEKYNFYFMDENNKIFMFDAHDDDTTDNVADIRGFYVDRDVYSVAVCGKYYQSYLFDDTLYWYSEAKEKYEERKNKLLENPIENVTYKDDKFTFETHYEKDMLVVSRVAYDVGWKIKATNKDNGRTMNVKIYKGNGGFVSFLALKGNYSYEMVYETPYLGFSYFVSALSVTTFFTSMCAYHIWQEKKRQHYLDDLFREN